MGGHGGIMTFLVLVGQIAVAFALDQIQDLSRLVAVMTKGLLCAVLDQYFWCLVVP